MLSLAARARAGLPPPSAFSHRSSEPEISRPPGRAASVRAVADGGGLTDLGAVHLAQRVGQQFQAGAVGVAEVDRGTAFHVVGDAGGVQVGTQVLPPFGRYRDG